MTLTLRLTITTWRYKTRFYDTYRPTCYGDPLVIPSRTQNRSKWACMYLRSAFFKIDFEMCLTADARRLPFWAMEKGDTRYPRWYVYAHWTSITVYSFNPKAKSNHTGFSYNFSLHSYHLFPGVGLLTVVDVQSTDCWSIDRCEETGDTYASTWYGEPLVIPSRNQNRSKWTRKYHCFLHNHHFVFAFYGYKSVVELRS